MPGLRNADQVKTISRALQMSGSGSWQYVMTPVGTPWGANQLAKRSQCNRHDQINNAQDLPEQKNPPVAGVANFEATTRP